MPKKTKRVVVISDLHCGHQVGLTPPSWHDTPDPTASLARQKLADFRKRTFSLYYKWIKELGQIDVLLVNADCIDGRGERSGQTELITSDRDYQCDMAAEIIKCAKAKKIVMTYGTPYHTGQIEDYENQIAKEVKAEKIGGHEWVDVNGLVFDMKHKVGSSGIPHGRHTAVAKENLWNILWSERNEAPRANIIIRSHVHYHSFSGGTDWLALTTPALQGPGSKYGTRQCFGTVDFGLLHFDVHPSGSYEWVAHTKRLLSKKESLLKL